MLYNSAETTPRFNAKAKYYKVDANGNATGEGKTFDNETSFAVWFDAVGQCWVESPQAAPTGNTNRSTLLSIDTPITWETVDKFNKDNQERSMRLPSAVIEKHKDGAPFTAIFVGLRPGLTKDKTRNFPQALIEVDGEKFRILVSDKLRPVQERGEFQAQLQPTDNPAVQSGFNLVVL